VEVEEPFGILPLVRASNRATSDSNNGACMRVRAFQASACM
jgi:hypothetical protein